MQECVGLGWCQEMKAVGTHLNATILPLLAPRACSCRCSLGFHQGWAMVFCILSIPGFLLVAPDTINNHVKTCREEQKNLHFFAPEYGGMVWLGFFLAFLMLPRCPAPCSQFQPPDRCHINSSEPFDCQNASAPLFFGSRGWRSCRTVPARCRVVLLHVELTDNNAISVLQKLPMSPLLWTSTPLGCVHWR